MQNFAVRLMSVNLAVRHTVDTDRITNQTIKFQSIDSLWNVNQHNDNQLYLDGAVFRGNAPELGGLGCEVADCCSADVLGGDGAFGTLCTSSAVSSSSTSMWSNKLSSATLST